MYPQDNVSSIWHRINNPIRVTWDEQRAELNRRGLPTAMLIGMLISPYCG